MAYYYSASQRAFYCTEIASVDVMPADKVAVSDEAYKSLMAAQNAGKLIRPGAGGVPEAVDQPGGAANGITHEVTAATADTLGHVKIGAGVNVTKDGTISVDTEVLFRQDSWSTRIASTLYAVGDIVDCPYKRNLELVCTQAGTTGSGDLAEGGLTHGATVTDGSVKWKVRAKTKTVNGQEADANGAVKIDVGVKTINNEKSDENGNYNVDISSKRDHTIQIANADLNTLLEDKTWACSGTLKNTPIACTFCIVQAYDTGAPISGNIVQVCYVPNQTDNTVRTFWRNCNNGVTFGKWSESGAVKTVNSIAPDASGEVTLPNATTSQFGLVRLAAEEDVLKESPQTAVCTQLIYEINEFRRKSTAYQVGEKVDCAFQYERFLECTKAGTTSADMLDTRDVTHGQVITDGTVEWTVRTHVRSINEEVAGANGNVNVYALRVRTLIDTDFNTVKTTGVYNMIASVAETAPGKNTPIGFWGLLTVEETTNYIIQEYKIDLVEKYVTPMTWRRCYNKGNKFDEFTQIGEWSVWKLESVDAIVEAVFLGSSWAKKFESGFVLMGGIDAFTKGQSEKIVTIPVPLNNNSPVPVVTPHWGADISMPPLSVTISNNTNFTVFQRNTLAETTFSWFAYGYWK